MNLKILRNKHFWIITGLSIFLALIYNAVFLNIEGLLLIFKDISTAKGVHAIISSFLFIIPVLYSSAIFRIKGTLISWSFFLLSILPRAVIEFKTFENLLILSLFIIVTLLLGLLMALDFNPLSTQYASEAIPRTKLHTLARLLRIRNYERQYVARQLHDNIIQSLLVVANKINAMENGKYGPVSPISKKNLSKLQEMLLHVIDDVRRLSQDLRPSVLDNVGLIPVVRWTVERVAQESGIKIVLNISGLEYRLPAELEVILYRIIQEALKNVVKHSQATKAVISIDFAENDIKLLIKDDGRGFELPDDLREFVKQGKSGIDRIIQQTKAMDGEFKIRSEINRGTELEFIFPL